jgi:hypothetical protein
MIYCCYRWESELDEGERSKWWPRPAPSPCWSASRAASAYLCGAATVSATTERGFEAPQAATSRESTHIIL